MLNPPVPSHLVDVLDRCAEVSRDCADRLEFFSHVKGEREKAIKLIRAAAFVTHGVLERRADREFLESLQQVMQAKTIGDRIDEARTR